MHFRQKKKLLSKVALFLLMIVLLAVMGGLAGLGCVRGLQPLGWSGGTVAEDVLYVGSQEGRLVAVNLADDSRQWSELLRASSQGGFGCAPTVGGGCTGGAAGVAIYGNPVVADGRVYIGGYNGKIYAFDAITLENRWVFPREGNLRPIVGGALVSHNLVFIGIADGQGWKLLALDAATGNQRWFFETEDKIWSTPAVSGDTVYVASFDKKLYALNVATGEEEWAQPFKTEGAIAAPPLVVNGTVYIGSFDRHLYAVEAATGEELWRFPATDDAENQPENWFWAKPVMHENIIYTPCLDGRVYALDAVTGREIDVFDLGSPVSSSPVIVDGTVVLATQQGLIYTLDTGSRQLMSLIDIEKEVYGPLSTSGSVVYIHTQDSTLHAVDVVTGAKLKTISLKTGE